MRLSHLVIASITLTLTSTFLFADISQSGRAEAYSPEQELAGFTVPDGFVVELVASEKDGVINPIDLTFDDAGRLWTQTARMYPLDPVKDIKWDDLLRLMDHPEEQDKNPEFKRVKDLYQGKTKGEDNILILSDIYSGKQPTVRKWATGLTIPQSILPYKNGAFVMQGSEFFFLEDTDNNGIADKRTPVLTGFGFTDTHTMGHSLVRAPGGWIYFSQGALNKGEIIAVKSGDSTRIDYSKIARVSLDGNKIELVNAGLQNIWGFQLRSDGQWFITEANDMGWSVVPAPPLAAYRGIGNETLRPYQPVFPAPHKFRVGGTGISGLAFNDDLTGTWSEKYKDVAFLANPITNKINAVKILHNVDGSVSAEHLPDFMTSTDNWFRPVNIEFGPDGNLYIADWYNKIVSHNEVATTSPDRDKTHGRIWRVRPKTTAERKVPNLYEVKSSALLSHLAASSSWERKAAWQQIADRQDKSLVPALVQLANDGSTATVVRIAALWSLESLGHFEPSLMVGLLKEKDENLRREALRSLVSFKLTADQILSLVSNLDKDPSANVRAQLIRTLEAIDTANVGTIAILVNFCHEAAKDNELGKGYQIDFERYLARRALERHPSELKDYLSSAAAKSQPAANILWAQQALANQTALSFLKQWQEIKSKPLDRDSMVILSDVSKDVTIKDAILPYFRDPKQVHHIAKLAMKNIADVYAPIFGYPIAETVQTLIKSKEKSDIILGLQLGRAYRITHLAPQFAELLSRQSDENIIEEIIKNLSDLPEGYGATLLGIMQDGKHSSHTRLVALSAYVQAAGPAAKPAITDFLSKNKADKTAVIESLGSTVQGCQLLVQLAADHLIGVDEISDAIGRRIDHLDKKSPAAIAIHDNVEKRVAAATLANTTRIPELEKSIAAKPGDPASGKALFTGMCLTCHLVGEEGVGIGPALDGSATRETNNLLTAILNPDEAAEAAYILFRVIDTAGHIEEGVKIKQDARGTTLAHQGGSTVFMPARTIKEQSPVGSVSFMPAGTFDKLPENIIADIVSYIKTLK